MKEKIMIRGISYNVIEQEQLHNIYVNNFGVNVYKMEDGNYLLQTCKLGSNVKKHRMIISKEKYRSLLDEQNKIQCVLDTLKMLDPDSRFIELEKEIEKYDRQRFLEAVGYDPDAQ